MKIKQLIMVLLMTSIGVSSFGQGADSLSHYLVIAAQNNPSIKSGFLAYQASLQKATQAGAYQDPTLDIGFFLEPMDIMGGRQVANFTLMQMFPWFGTRKAARSEMTHMAKMSFEQFRESRDNLYFDIYSQWFIMCSLQQKLMNNRDNHRLLTQLEQLAIRKFSSPTSSSGSYAVSAPTAPTSTPPATSGGGGMVGMGAGTTTTTSSDEMSSMGGGGGGAMSGSSSGGMSDVLRIQLELAELDNNIESILSEIRAEKAKFNALLNRPAQSELTIPDSFEQISFLFDETSMGRVATQNPMLGMITQEGEAYKAKAKMDRKMSYPMFGIGLQYMLINKSKGTSMGTMSSMNGKDMIMPMVSLTIPIYRGKYKAQQRESNFWWQASQRRYDDTRNALESELYRTKHQLDDASRKIALYQKQSELAQTTYNLIVQEFVAGKSDLTNVIQVQRQLLDYQLKKAESIATYNTMVASIQKLISFNDTETEKQ